MSKSRDLYRLAPCVEALDSRPMGMQQPTSHDAKTGNNALLCSGFGVPKILRCDCCRQQSPAAEQISESGSESEIDAEMKLVSSADDSSDRRLLP